MSENMNDTSNPTGKEKELEQASLMAPIHSGRSGRLVSIRTSRLYRRVGLSGRALIFLVLVALFIGTGVGIAKQNFIIGLGAAFVVFVVVTSMSLLLTQIWKRIRR